MPQRRVLAANDGEGEGVIGHGLETVDVTRRHDHGDISDFHHHFFHHLELRVTFNALVVYAFVGRVLQRATAKHQGFPDTMVMWWDELALGEFIEF